MQGGAFCSESTLIMMHSWSCREGHTTHGGAFCSESTLIMMHSWSCREGHTIHVEHFVLRAP